MTNTFHSDADVPAKLNPAELNPAELNPAELNPVDYPQANTRPEMPETTFDDSFPLPEEMQEMPFPYDRPEPPFDGPHRMPPHGGPGMPPYGRPEPPFDGPHRMPPHGGPGMPPPCGRPEPPFDDPHRMPPHGGPGMPPPCGRPEPPFDGPHRMPPHGGPGMPPPPDGHMPPTNDPRMMPPGMAPCPHHPGRPVPENWKEEDELTRLLRACGHKLIHQDGSGKRQEQILKLLYEYETLSQRELLSIVQIQPGSLSELISKLETKGLIERKRKQEDRRIMMLTLTDAGLTLTESLSGSNSPMAYAALTEEEQKTLKDLLKKLLKSWTDDSEKRPMTQRPGGFINC